MISKKQNNNQWLWVHGRRKHRETLGLLAIVTPQIFIRRCACVNAAPPIGSLCRYFFAQACRSLSVGVWTSTQQGQRLIVLTTGRWLNQVLCNTTSLQRPGRGREKERVFMKEWENERKSAQPVCVFMRDEAATLSAAHLCMCVANTIALFSLLNIRMKSGWQSAAVNSRWRHHQAEAEVRSLTAWCLEQNLWVTLNQTDAHTQMYAHMHNTHTVVAKIKGCVYSYFFSSSVASIFNSGGTAAQFHTAWNIHD